ncbi:MAG: hypothetical protein FJW69_04735 [Actinobacteria bacterium]|nr:hypothetical protein [Actinomycetota bacterium]
MTPPLNDYTKLQALLFEKEMDLIKEFKPEGYNSISLAVLFKPNDARLTKLYDYVNNGGKAVCYYDNNTAGYNDTLDDFFGVSITKEDIYKDNTNSITLDGELFSDFTDGLQIAFIKQVVTSMKINSYINDNNQTALWHSEFLSQESSKSNYFALIKSIGDGEILFIPHVASIIPFSDKHYDNMDNEEFAENMINWSLE